MARKDLLKDLIAGAGDAPAAAPAPRMTRGAIGAVSQSIADLRSRALIDVPADLIDGAGLADRMEPEAGLDELAESIRLHGQQVPVMLRHSPNYEGRYEVVYGRRRVAALRRLGLPVRAMVRDLGDRALIVAQGQENTARRDLSFIEKARFAAQMVRMGFDRQVICEALSIDKTVASRMLAVIDALPEAVLQAIGPAPGVGRDRWLALAGRARGWA
ncbi:MAG: plasmid partitioning protein RepB, partial [Gemmobacter sp.]